MQSIVKTSKSDAEEAIADGPLESVFFQISVLFVLSGLLCIHLIKYDNSPMCDMDVTVMEGRIAIHLHYLYRWIMDAIYVLRHLCVYGTSYLSTMPA